MDENELRAAGLYDPDAANAPDRLALLRFCIEQGITLEEMVEADREGRLAGLAATRLILPPGPRYTAAEVAARAGIAPELAVRVWRAAGFPDPGDACSFTDEDVASISNAASAIGFFGEDVALQFVRVMGSSCARMAEAMLSSFEANVGAPMREAEAEAVEVARANAMAAALVPIFIESLGPLLRHHLQLSRQRRWAAAVGPSTPTMRMGVGFADLVGWTELSQQLSARELARAISEFEALTLDVISSADGRLVKLIGDEVMFVAPDGATSCRIATALAETFDDHPLLPPMRIGMAIGELLPHDGDYFGVPVNLAARIVKEGAPAQMLVDEALRAAGAEAGFRFEPVGARRLKGFADRYPLYELVR